MVKLELREIGFEEIKEGWNYYKLDDGTTLKLKIVLVKIIDEGKDSQGNPIHGIQSTHVVGVNPSKELVENKSIPEIEDLNFEIIKELWNEYKLEDGSYLMLKPALTQVNRTGKLDQKNIPIYNVQTQLLIKFRK